MTYRGTDYRRTTRLLTACVEYSFAVRYTATLTEHFPRALRGTLFEHDRKPNTTLMTTPIGPLLIRAHCAQRPTPNGWQEDGISSADPSGDGVSSADSSGDGWQRSPSDAAGRVTLGASRGALNK